MKTKPFTTIVLHATAGRSAASSIAWLYYLAKNTIKGDEASYQYIIERDGEITKCVPLSRVAFHAGKSFGPQGKNVNDYSIGIAFANMDDGEPYTSAQITACNSLIAELVKAEPSLKWITRHRDIAPKRKKDPEHLVTSLIRAGKLKWWVA